MKTPLIPLADWSSEAFEAEPPLPVSGEGFRYRRRIVERIRPGAPLEPRPSPPLSLLSLSVRDGKLTPRVKSGLLYSNDPSRAEPVQVRPIC